MKLVNGAIELEQCERPGSLGDSCAETARYAHLKMLLGDYVQDYQLGQFITHKGYVRHPDCPPSWLECDFSSDQALPLYLAISKLHNSPFEQMSLRFKRAGYRTGNGDLLTPGLFAEMYAPWLRVPLLLAQLALFKFKYRWNDEKNKFEENEESSCDYLNFIHVAVYAPRWLRRMLDRDVLIKKVYAYYMPEPYNELTTKVHMLYWDVICSYFGKDAK